MVSNGNGPARLAGSEGLVLRAVQKRLEARGAKGLAAEDLERELPEFGGDEVRQALVELEREGLGVEWSRRWFAVRFTEWQVGTVEALEDGEALVRPRGAREGGFFVERRHLKGAEDRDLVLIKRLKGRAQSAGGRRLPPAAVVKILASRLHTVVGTVEERDGRVFLVPYDAKVLLEIEIVGAPSLAPSEWVVVELETASGKVAGHRRGRVIERLGSLSQAGTDVLVVLRHYGIPEEFPREVLAAAAAMPADPPPGDWRGRLDLRDSIIVTIDGETARDFDDAISIARSDSGGWRLGVHIADVAFYVQEGTALDLEAYRRGTSVYYPERAIPMLPEALSNGLCSLRPGVPRLAFSAFLEFDAAGELQRRSFAESVIRSTRRLTYTEVRRVLEAPEAGDAATYGDVLPRLQSMRELMQLLLGKRIARGSIDFDLPEGDVVLDTDGATVGIRPGERNVAHRIVEEFMIAANEAVAFTLETSECPALHRVHDAPSVLRLEELRDVMRSLGHDLPGELENLHPSALQEALRAVAGRPEEGFVTALVLRTVQRALYSPESRGHYALAAQYYTHFTSPIRRYPDLIVHRRLRALLAGTAKVDAERSLLAERLPVVGEHCSEMERRAEQSERDLLQWKKVRFLATRAGEVFEGRITGVQAFGFFVQLTEWFVDGMVPIRTLADDFYVFEPENHRLIGQERGRVFQLAQAVRVQLLGVDERRRGLQLRIEGMPEPRNVRRESGQRPPRPAGSRYDRRR